jgi:chromosome segregation ATPase
MQHTEKNAEERIKKLEEDNEKLRVELQLREQEIEKKDEKLRRLQDDVRLNWEKLKKYTNQNKKLTKDVRLQWSKLKKYVDVNNVLHAQNVELRAELEQYEKILTVVAMYLIRNEHVEKVNRALLRDINVLFKKTENLPRG